MTRWVLHVDLDQFLAAVEVLRNPELAGRPVVVGGDGDPTKRGVVSTASYEARELGVHSGLPMRTAARRAPDAVFLPVDRETYEAVSEVVMATLRSLDATVEVLGWDEAFVEPTTPPDDPEPLAREIQRRVLEATGLACSVGIGNNKVQAKIATAFGKPAGVGWLTDETWFPVLGERPTDALWGIGAKTSKRLAALGIGTVRELAVAERAQLAAAFGPTNGPWLQVLARGRSSSPVVGTPYVPRSRSRETTFQQDLTDWDTVRREVALLATRVTADVVAEGRAAVRVVVKVRYPSFRTLTHGRTLPEPTADGAVIGAAALAAIDDVGPGRPVRLLGVRADLTPPDDG